MGGAETKSILKMEHARRVTVEIPKNCMWRARVSSENFGESSLSKLKSTL